MPYPMYPTYPQYYPPYQTMPTQIQQPVQQTVQPTMQPQTAEGLIWVSSDNDAAMYPVAPNRAIAMWNQNQPVAYLKQADASGKPSLKIFDLVERVDQPADGAKQETTNNVPYALKKDVAPIIDAVNMLNDAITSIKGDIEKMNGDLYGIAGKKKSSKKTESEDEP